MWVDRSFKRIFQRYSQDKKGSLGFFVAEPEKLKFDYVPKKKETAKKKYGRTNRRQKRQSGSFLNRYDFAYARRDVVNQAAKVSPGKIKAAANSINKSQNR